MLASSKHRRWKLACYIADALWFKPAGVLETAFSAICQRWVGCKMINGSRIKWMNRSDCGCFFPLEIKKTKDKCKKKKIVNKQLKNWPFSFVISPPLFTPFFKWRLVFNMHNLSSRTLIIAFTDTVGLRLCAKLPTNDSCPAISPDEQRSVISACQRQPQSPAGRLFGQIMLNTVYLNSISLQPCVCVAARMLWMTCNLPVFALGRRRDH